MNEIWKDIKGYEKLYQVSNLGRVKSLPKFHRTNKFYSSIGYMSKEKILKPLKQSCNYLQVDLCDINGKRRKKYIHKLVAEAFIPNPNNYEYVNHKDEKKTNNKIDNLEWCSFDYNLNYGTRNARIKISHLKRNIEHLQQENQQLKEKVGELTQSLNEQMKLTNEENLDCSKYAIENNQLKENNQNMQIEMCRSWEKADLYKEVIEEVWNFIKSYPGISQSGVMTIKAILHKVKGE